MLFSTTYGNITEFRADAIVNAANSRLRGGGGVDGAIHRAAGPELMVELIDRYPNGMVAGDAVVTFAYNLPAMYVIHTVGPRYFPGSAENETLLESCYLRSLMQAERLGLESIVFPAISTGVYGYPLHDATQVAIKTIESFEPESLRDVTLLFHNSEMLEEALHGPVH
jgi:O-acetyl-ADP-ribose deacetylase (regulator of RNase III)